MTTKPLMRYHGAKWRLAPWIISHFPSHYCYVEPFGGSAAVLISKEPSAREVYNDKNDEIVNLFNVIRCNKMRPELLRLLHMTPYSRTEFEWAKEINDVNRDMRGQIKSGYPAVMEAHKLLVRAQKCCGYRLIVSSNRQIFLMRWVHEVNQVAAGTIKAKVRRSLRYQCRAAF